MQDKRMLKLGVTHSILRTFFVFMILLGVGWLIPVSENLYLPRYQNIAPFQVLIKNRVLIEETGMNLPDLDKFIKEPQADILLGRALYPIHYEMNQGEFSNYLSITKGFPRTSFSVIGPAGEYTVILPGDVPRYFPHAIDVLVLGCHGQVYFDALFVIILSDDNNVVYTRRPESKLQCPLQQPV